MIIAGRRRAKECYAQAALAVAGVCLAGSAEASVEVKVKTTSYRISGENGKALLRAMDRKGPRQGFTTHFMAQTAYRADGSSTGKKRQERAVLPMLRPS